MKRIALLSCFIYFAISYGQNHPDSKAFPLAIDSVRFHSVVNITLEMTTPGNEPYTKMLDSTLLEPKVSSKLLKKLQKKSTYDRGRALLTHYNLSFFFYNKGINTLQANISTLPRNIDLAFKNDVVFNGKISKKFGKYVLKLLIRYGFYNALNERGDLEGIL